MQILRNSNTLERLPEEWNSKKLKELVVLLKDGTHTPPARVKNGIPLLSAESIHDGIIDFKKGVTYITQQDYDEIHKKYEIQKNDLLLTIVGTLGRVSLVDSLDKKFSVQLSVSIIRTNNDILPIFLYYFFQTKYYQQQLMNKSKSTAQRGIYLGELSQIHIFYPKEIKEQQKIAAILSSIDKLIQKIEQLIEQTQILKKGLMQRLLTNGIGHTKFKRTELGEIPEDWSISNISKICELIMGQSPPGDSYNSNGEGIALLNGPTEFGLEHPIPIQFTTKPTKLCKENDILLCVRGSTTGRLNISNGTYCIGRGLAAIRGFENKANTKWLYYHFLRLQNYIFNIASGGGSTFPNINRDIIEKILLPYPSFIEQQKISSIISNVDLSIKQYIELKSKILIIKKGLMQQLLTGKIRVKV